MELKDFAAERAVLAGFCQLGLDAALDLDFIEPDHFTHEVNQAIFKCVKKNLTESSVIDLSGLLSAANNLGFGNLVENKDEVEFLRSLFNFPIHKDNLVVHAGKLAKLKLGRDMMQTLNVCQSQIKSITGDEDIQDIISLVETPVLEATSSVYESGGTKPETLGDEVLDYVEHLAENKVEMIGISTGFPRYDKAIGGGLRRKCVDLVAARPKVGKSMFGDAVALHVAKNLNIPVLVLDTEMSKEDHYNRILANLSDVDMNEISTGKFADNDSIRERVTQAAEDLQDIPYHYISIAGQPFENILGIMRKWIHQEVGFDEDGRTNDCLVVYDYLKLMNSASINNSMQEFQVLGFQITQLHNFMVKHDCACLSFVQLNRDGITKESTDVVSGSDRLIWLCTSFTIFKLKSDEEMADDGHEEGNRKLVPVVARHGGGLDDGNYINLSMIGEKGRLVENKTRNELKYSTNVSDKGFAFNGIDEEEFDLQEME